MSSSAPIAEGSRPGAAAIADHAMIGNKRTAALVAIDGTIDWLCPQRFDGPSAFAALLDPERGGSFLLRPADGFSAQRRYRPNTNVVETTFTTTGGRVRVTDAMAMPADRGIDFNQVIRRVDGLAGTVPMCWLVAPRFDYGARAGRAGRRGGVPVIADGDHVLTVQSHGAGDAVVGDHDVRGAFTCAAGATAFLALSSFDTGPLAFSSAEQLAARLEATAEHWERWARGLPDVGRWSDACRRSALALDLMVDADTGGIVAAPTLALPERVGGDRNYDYRYVWLRDTNLTLEAMLRLGLTEQVHASLRWMFQATSRSHPRLSPMFCLDGGAVPLERPVGLRENDGSEPVKVGNRARAQLQLDCYGHVFDMVWKYVEHGNALTDGAGVRLAELADFVCVIWRRPDSGLWELPDTDHFTQSKLGCALALRRAGALAQRAAIPGAHVDRWHAAYEDIRRYVHERCWSDELGAYTRAAGSCELDAAILLAARGGVLADEPDRLSRTIDAIRGRLGAGGPLLYRTTSDRGREGAFLACSFWTAEALARVGRLDEAERMLDDLVVLANDAGLYAEEVDPDSGAFRGNFPQALTHLALVNAADVCARARSGRPCDPGGPMFDGSQGPDHA